MIIKKMTPIIELFMLFNFVLLSKLHESKLLKKKKKNARKTSKIKRFAL